MKFYLIFNTIYLSMNTPWKHVSAPFIVPINHQFQAPVYGPYVNKTLLKTMNKLRQEQRILDELKDMINEARKQVEIMSEDMDIVFKYCKCPYEASLEEYDKISILVKRQSACVKSLEQEVRIFC